MLLESLGWNCWFEENFETHARAGLVPGRVLTEANEIYRVASSQGEVWAELSGGLRYRAAGREDLPAVGDWLALQSVPPPSRSIVRAVLPRRTRIARKAAGEREELQLIAANVDTVWIVSSANRDWNPRRIERYLTVVRDGGAEPVVVLSKVDLAEDLAPYLAEAEAVAGGAAVLTASGKTGEGVAALERFLAPGRTVALLGSSGVGKSTLVNRLLGEDRQAVREIRASDDRGRHATTRRELFAVPAGGLLLDTPGMRELALMTDAAAVEEVFDDVEALAERCRFRDCQHQGEPGCAVAGAVAGGELAAERLESYQKLQREESFRSDRDRFGANYAEKKRWHAFHKKLQK